LNEILSTESLATYAKNDEKNEFFQYAKPESYKIENPNCCPNTPEELINESGEINFNRPFVCSIKNPLLLGPEPLITTPTGEFLYEGAAGRKHMVSRGVVRSICDGVNPFKTHKDNKKYDYERLCLLTGSLSDAFAHWFHDYLPRLEGLEHYMNVTGNKPPILISSDPPTWMLDSLRHLGYDEEDIVRWNSSTARVKELIIPSLRLSCLSEGPNDPKHLHRTGYEYRNRIINSVMRSQTPSTSPNIIYINRKDAPTRRILNRNELLTKLDIFEIESVTMSDLSFSDQVSKIQDIDGIIAPHGAGLLNMLWGDDLFIIEIFGSHVTAGNMSLAHNIGHEYRCISAEVQGIARSSPHEDIIVDKTHIQAIKNYVLQY
jgi:hypothetical protein